MCEPRLGVVIQAGSGTSGYLQNLEGTVGTAVKKGPSHLRKRTAHDSSKSLLRLQSRRGFHAGEHRKGLAVAAQPNDLFNDLLAMRSIEPVLKAILPFGAPPPSDVFCIGIEVRCQATQGQWRALSNPVETPEVLHRTRHERVVDSVGSTSDDGHWITAGLRIPDGRGLKGGFAPRLERLDCLESIASAAPSGSEELGGHEQCRGELVRLLFVAIGAAKPRSREVLAAGIQDGIDVSGQPVVPDLMGHREFLEALVVNVGGICDAEHSIDVEKHSGGPAGGCRERLHVDVELPRNRERIDRQVVDLEFTEELFRLPMHFEELFTLPGHLLALPSFPLGLLRQHLDELIGHLLILGREAGVVPVELVDGGG